MKLLAFFFVIFPIYSSENIYVYDFKDSNFHINQKDIPNNTNSDFYFTDLVNLSSTKGSNKTKFFQVRGIGEYEEFTPLVRRSVTVRLNDIDYSDIPHGMDTFGLNQNYLLFGPSLFNGQAGAILMQDSSFKKDSTLEANLKIGNYTTHSQKVQYQSSNTVKIPYSITLIKNYSDGYYENSYLNKDNTNKTDEYFLRTNLELFKNINYRFHYSHQENGYDAFVQNNSYTTESDHPGKDYLYHQAHQLNYSSRLEQTKIQTTLNYLKFNSIYAYDEDWGNDTKWLNTAGFNSTYNYHIEYLRDKSSIEVLQKIQFSNFGHLRLSFQNQEEEHRERGYLDENVRKDILTNLNEKIYNIGFTTLFPLGNFANLISEASYHHRRLKIGDSTNFIHHLNQDLSHLSLALEKKEYQIKIARATHPGGINTQSNVPDNRKIYKKESATHIELAKKFQVNKFVKSENNLFYIHRKEIQVKSSVQENPNDPSTFTFFTDNASEAKHYGIETQNELNVTPFYSIIFNLSFLKTKFGNYEFGDRNLKDREVPNAPEYKFILSQNIKLSSSTNIKLKYYQQDNYFFSNSHDIRARGFNLLDLSLVWSLNKFKLNFYINNLLDKDYVTRGYYFGNNPPNFNDELYTQRGAPRRFGVNMSYSL